MSISCLDARSFTSLNAYHNDRAILSINELVADLHRHEDFIGVDRSSILGSIEDDITAELISFNFGKTAIVNVLSLISTNLINLIDAEVDEYTWCDPDGNPYSGRDTIDDDVLNHLAWVGIISNIRDILQQLVCKCTVEIELPPGQDIIFNASYNMFSDNNPNDWTKKAWVAKTNQEAHSEFINSPDCPHPFNIKFFNYEGRFQTKNNQLPGQNWVDCHGNETEFNEKDFIYRSFISNNVEHSLIWTDSFHHLAQPGDIPFELISSEFSVYVQDAPEHDMLMDVAVSINNAQYFIGTISKNNTEFFPTGPEPSSGNRIVTTNWGEVLPQFLHLHSGQDKIKVRIDDISFPIVSMDIPEVFVDERDIIKRVRINNISFTVKARRPF